MSTATAALKEAGVNVREVAPPFAAELPALWGTLMFTETEALLRGEIAAKGSPQMQRYYGAFAKLFTPADITGLLRAMQRRVVCQRAWAQMFEEIDALLLPTSLARPFENDLDFRDPARLPEIVAAQAPLLSVNVLGLPAVALPTHLEGRTPLGVQLVGPMHADDRTLDIAQHLEDQLGTLWQSMPDPGMVGA